MALAESARPWWMSVTLGGLDDSRQTRRYNLVADDAAAAETAGGTIRAALANVSAGKIIGYKIEHEFVEDTYARPSSQDAEGGEQAYVSGKIDESPLESWSLNIPFPVIGLFLATEGKNRNVIDITDTALLAYTALFAPSTGSAYISDGEFIGTVEQGRRK